MLLAEGLTEAEFSAAETLCRQVGMSLDSALPRIADEKRAFFGANDQAGYLKGRVEDILSRLQAARRGLYRLRMAIAGSRNPERRRVLERLVNQVQMGISSIESVLGRDRGLGVPWFAAFPWISVAVAAGLLVIIFLSIKPFQEFVEETGRALKVGVNIAAVAGSVLGLVWLARIAGDIWSPREKRA